MSGCSRGRRRKRDKAEMADAVRTFNRADENDAVTPLMSFSVP